MRTTIEVSPQLIKEAMKLSGVSKKKEAVRLALEEFVRRKKLERLVSLVGKIDIIDVSEELEEAELVEFRSNRRSD